MNQPLAFKTDATTIASMTRAYEQWRWCIEANKAMQLAAKLKLESKP